MKSISSAMVMGAFWSPHPVPQCGGWVLTLLRTLMTIRLTVGELDNSELLYICIKSLVGLRRLVGGSSCDPCKYLVNPLGFC